jgi:hypothetical protein
MFKFEFKTKSCFQKEQKEGKINKRKNLPQPSLSPPPPPLALAGPTHPPPLTSSRSPTLGRPASLPSPVLGRSAISAHRATPWPSGILPSRPWRAAHSRAPRVPSAPGLLDFQRPSSVRSRADAAQRALAACPARARPASHQPRSHALAAHVREQNRSPSRDACLAPQP